MRGSMSAVSPACPAQGAAHAMMSGDSSNTLLEEDVLGLANKQCFSLILSDIKMIWVVY